MSGIFFPEISTASLAAKDKLFFVVQCPIRCFKMLVGAVWTVHGLSVVMFQWIELAVGELSHSGLIFLPPNGEGQCYCSLYPLGNV